MVKRKDLYEKADRIQQECVDEYDEEMIDNIYEKLKSRNNSQHGSIEK